MSDRQALFLAIRAAPDDDLPRLAYADWLEEHGEAERAEIIRVQVELTRLGEDDPSGAKLRRRERALLNAHREWADTGLGVFGTLRRGLIEEVALGADQFLEIGPALADRFPLRRVTLRLYDDLPKLRLLAASEALAGLREVCVQRPSSLPENSIGELGLRAFLRSPHLGNVRVLELVTLHLTDRAAADIAGAASLGPLEALDLRNSRLTWRGLEELAAAPRLRGLKRLVLHRNPIGPRGAEVLAASPWRPVSLDLMRTYLQTVGVRTLTAGPFLEAIRELSLQWMSLSVQAAGAVARCPHAAGLRTLLFNRNKLADAGAEALARAPLLAGLRHLGLHNNRLTAAGMSAVAESPHLRNLHTLELGGNRISAKERENLHQRFGKRFARF